VKKIVLCFIFMVILNSCSDQTKGQSNDIASRTDIGVSIYKKAFPMVTLEKSKYVLGESVRFWIGVKSIDDEKIPEKYWKTCILYITRPDGTVKKEERGWPCDGMIDYGWMGGCGLGEDKVQVGEYTLVFEFANQKTESVKLIVEDVDILKKIKAEFIFGQIGDISQNTQIPITFRVQNDSSNIIQFPKRSSVNANIGILIKIDKPPEVISFFYPADKLFSDGSNISYDVYNWDMAKRVSTVMLKPGEHFVQELLLQDAYQFRHSGQHTITFSTTLDILIDDEKGTLAKFCPIRLPVTATGNFDVK